MGSIPSPPTNLLRLISRTHFCHESLQKVIQISQLAAARAIAKFVAETSTAQLSIEDSARRMHAILPPAAVHLLQEILREMSQAHAITLIPVHAEVTTQQAADLLNVSRPYLVSLLESGAIPYRKVGTRRRVLFDHLMAYKKAEDAKRLEALNELTRQVSTPLCLESAPERSTGRPRCGIVRGVCAPWTYSTRAYHSTLR